MSEKEYIERGAVLDQMMFEMVGTGVQGRAMDVIRYAHSADVVEVRHGEWIKTTEPLGAHDVDCVECSACGESWILDVDFDFDVVKDFWNYCPNCGARMDGERKDIP